MLGNHGLMCTSDGSGARGRNPGYRNPGYRNPADDDRQRPPLPAPPPGAILAEREVTAAGLRGLRELLRASGQRLGMSTERVEDLVLAVDEVASNAVRHGGGRGRLRLWPDGDAVVCEITDDGGGLADPLAGQRPPPVHAQGGRGLWICRQLADLVQLRTGPAGTTVRLRSRLR